MQVWLLVTVLLGAGFLGVEIYEFMHYTHEFGFTITSSALGSAFYTLVGTHGAHVAFGLLWISALMIRNAKEGSVFIMRRNITWPAYIGILSMSCGSLSLPLYI